jgi:hypothetical protein
MSAERLATAASAASTATRGMRAGGCGSFRVSLSTTGGTMNEYPDYGRDLLDVEREIWRLASRCGVDLRDMNKVGALLHDQTLRTATLDDRARLRLRGLMFLRSKIWHQMQN